MNDQVEQVRVTAKQAAIMAFIVASREENGYSPSNAEIAEHFGFASQTAVVDQVRSLTKKHCVTKAPGKNRSLVVTDIGRNACFGSGCLVVAA